MIFWLSLGAVIFLRNGVFQKTGDLILGTLLQNNNFLETKFEYQFLNHIVPKYNQEELISKGLRTIIQV